MDVMGSERHVIGCRVTVQFSAGGPAVSGEWTDANVAHQKFRGWVGTYGSDERAVIRFLADLSDGDTRLVKTWTKADGEVVAPPDEG
ncbi:hypothetical protein WKI65_43530 [Streptomyces sp. MS1.AVA.3]|uniref:hypothetical protein n=1 Tax=Streptomyces decoyicus TaxID=249567 RepID=UPI0030C18E10